MLLRCGGFESETGDKIDFGSEPVGDRADPVGDSADLGSEAVGESIGPEGLMTSGTGDLVLPALFDSSVAVPDCRDGRLSVSHKDGCFST